MTNILYFLKANFFKLVSFVFVYFAPIHALFFLIGSSILIDTWFGRWAAKHLAIRNGEDVRLTVTSQKTRKGLVSKMLSYNIVISLLFIMDKFFMNDLLKYFIPGFPIDFAITKLIGLVIVAIEFDSIDEKVYWVKGYRIRDKVINMLKRMKTAIAAIVSTKKDITG